MMIPYSFPSPDDAPLVASSRWRLEFGSAYGASYWCEVDAPTALGAVTAALRHVNERNASAMFFATSISIIQVDNLAN